ncbi:CENP-B protein [Schizophyllum commune H4-8]|nr:CENP-B protein [Schizophyllum commune H4-8]KAI5887752.1 CENP-B protein [Schizophyllum commune H4-8]
MEGQREYVIVGRKSKGRAHQQSGGSRENITVIITICADGTALPPTVIFEGKGYQVSWGLPDNPLGASVGHSLRGWTNGEIGVVWIKEFDRLTKAKAAGRPRLLLLDGHNSHYTQGFLEYARSHNIRAICYPAHTTHILQGLDVVVFGPLKRALWEVLRWEGANTNSRPQDDGQRQG